MSEKVVTEIRQAQEALHEAIRVALTKFSNDTGLLVTDARWELAVTLDRNGTPADFAYYGFSSTISTGPQ